MEGTMMKLTAEQIKQLIKEELEKLSNERESEKFGDNDIDLKYLKKMQQANK